MLICLPVMQPQTTILVTGAAGTLGRVVFASLQREGYRVRGFDRLCCPWSDQMDWVTGALQSAQDCQRALQGVRIVIHLAAVPDDAPFESDLMPSNILGLHYLLEAAKESGVQRILMASTGQVVWEPLNHGPWPVRAHVAPSPLSWYALTKVFAEEAGKVMARDFGMDVMMVRLGACPRSPEHAQQIGADPIARDVYFSPGDLAQFFKLAVSMPWQGFHCLNAASRPLDQERLSLGEAKDLLGYEPVDQWPDAVEAYWS